MKEQVSVDNVFDMQRESLNAAIKEIAEKRTKIIEDYMKFYLAVTVPNNLTPESFVADYHLLVKDCTEVHGSYSIAYQMLPHYQLVIDKEEYDRLKRLDENVKRKIEECKSCISPTAGLSNIQQILLDKIEFLESLDK